MGGNLGFLVVNWCRLSIYSQLSWQLEFLTLQGVTQWIICTPSRPYTIVVRNSHLLWMLFRFHTLNSLSSKTFGQNLLLRCTTPNRAWSVTEAAPLSSCFYPLLVIRLYEFFLNNVLRMTLICLFTAKNCGVWIYCISMPSKPPPCWDLSSISGIQSPHLTSLWS